MQQTLRELNRSMKGFQPGAPAYTKMLADMPLLGQILRELQPVLRTLNSKSNALAAVLLLSACTRGDGNTYYQLRTRRATPRHR